MKRILFVLGVILAIGLLIYIRSRPAESTLQVRTLSVEVESKNNVITKAQAPAPTIELTGLSLASQLNDPKKTIRDDLRVLDSVFSVWQTNFLRTGNPLGENAEITAALTGKNSLHVAFISPHHSAINRAGELCDRWGTPFFFHQISGSQMEIRSAGPDKIRGTADDAILTP